MRVSSGAPRVAVSRLDYRPRDWTDLIKQTGGIEHWEAAITRLSTDPDAALPE
jgi:hypothetical protein